MQNHRSGFAALAMLLAVAVTGSVGADEFWTAEKVWTFHVTIPESDWDQMQPARPSRWSAIFGGGGGRRGAPEPGKEEDEPRRRRNQELVGRSFGFELPYIFCTVEFQGEVIRDVGMRFKGNSSYALSRNSLKKPFKLDFNRYLEDGEFRAAGATVTLLNFNNNAMDPSQIREAVAYGVFREAGVPASRTAFARVYVTVPNVHERKYIGLYTVIEEVNKEFLKDRFGSSKGLLLKPEGVRAFEHLGDEWSAYHAQYDPRGATRENTRRFIEFLKLVDDDTEEGTFRDRIGHVLDLNAFARFLAVHVVLSNTDSFLAMGHNYHIYLDPKTDKIHFIPWDLNLSMGGFMLAGNIEQQMDLSIDTPHVDYNNLIRRLLAMNDFRERYRGHVKGVVEQQFRVDRMHAEIERMQKLIHEAVEEEKKAGEELGDRAMGPWRPMELKAFIEGRVKSIEEQLAGRSKGTPPMPHRRPDGARLK